MHIPSNNRAAIYTKEAAGYPPDENSKELQLQDCEEYCQQNGLYIVAQYSDPAGSRHNFEWMMGDATSEEDTPFDFVIVRKLRNFSWSLDETVLCRARLRARGIELIHVNTDPIR